MPTHTLFVLLLGACTGAPDDTEELSDDTASPVSFEVTVQVTVVGTDDLNPNGSGSGAVELRAVADGAVRYDFDLGDGTTTEGESGTIDHTYGHEGVETFDVTVTAFEDTGEEATWTGSVTVYRSTSPFATVVWADEFDGDGALDAEKWHHQVFPPSDGRWFNGELQHYTDRLDNSFISDGTLKIVARKESYTAEGVALDYTSARLNTRFAFTYGRVEVRARLPAEAGTWPAIWTLGANINEPGNAFGTEYGDVGWPACGEIDIMEQTGWDKSSTLAYFHWSHTGTGAYETEGSDISNPSSTTDFHVYVLEWDEEYLRAWVDDDLVHELQNTDTRPYDNPHYLLLNVAMGGNLGGAVPSGFDEATMEIDYVRIYQ